MKDDFTSGFGALVVAERDLREQLLASITAGQADGALRIFRHHVLQIEAVIALLEGREQLLPHPARFEALRECVTQDLNPLRKIPQNVDAPLEHLVKMHQALRRGIEVLVEQSGHHDHNETALREAAQRHGEMEWMITALVNENSRPGQETGVVPGKAEGIWENEGGPALPGSIATALKPTTETIPA